MGNQSILLLGGSLRRIPTPLPTLSRKGKQHLTINSVPSEEFSCSHSTLVTLILGRDFLPLHLPPYLHPLRFPKKLNQKQVKSTYLSVLDLLAASATTTTVHSNALMVLR